jgi:hypothetical protein
MASPNVTKALRALVMHELWAKRYADNADYQAAYRAARREELAAKTRQWRLDNPERAKALDARGNARAKARRLAEKNYDAVVLQRARDRAAGDE